MILFSVVSFTQSYAGEYDSITQKQNKEENREKTEQHNKAKGMSALISDQSQLFDIVVSTIKEMEKHGVKFGKNRDDMFDMIVQDADIKIIKTGLGGKVVMFKRGSAGTVEAYRNQGRVFIRAYTYVSGPIEISISLAEKDELYSGKYEIMINGRLLNNGEIACDKIECSTDDRICVKAHRKDIKDCIINLVKKSAE